MTCSDLNLEKGPSNPPDNSDLFAGQIDIYIERRDENSRLTISLFEGLSS